MTQARELAKLNLVLEMATECAGLVDVESVVQVVAARLRWILDFELCELVLREGDQLRWRAMTSSDDSLTETRGQAERSDSFELVSSALSTGAPNSRGLPISRVAYPLGSPSAPKGVLCLTRSAGFSHRELRLIHHVSAGLGAVLSRIEQEHVIAGQRLDAQRAIEEARREKTAKEEATAANEAKDSFMAMLGHELRNPLAPILTATTLLSRVLDGKPLAKVQIIERQAKHLDRLVSDLLDVSRITTGRISLRRKVIDIALIVNKAAEMALPGMERKGQHLTVLLPDEAVFVDGDEVRLTQVLSNLLNNASNFSSAEKTVTLRAAAEGAEVVLTVRDEGIGMSANTIGKVFDLYVQGQQSKDWSPGGLGLGLTVSRALTELHDGSLKAESAGEGLGSLFTVRLPAASEQPIELTAASETSNEGFGRHQRILVVDDNVDAANFLGEILAEQGHEVRVAYGPTQALEAVNNFIPEIGILDIGMPVMNGYELAAALRKQPTLGTMRLFALSGYGQDSDKNRSLHNGFELHMVKPANLSQIIEAINKAA